jgi:hypothetical protein
MKFDYSKLNGRIVEVFGTQKAFAEAMNLSERTISLKMNSKIYFNQDEIVLGIQLLKLTVNDIPDYFFTLKVQVN